MNLSQPDKRARSIFMSIAFVASLAIGLLFYHSPDWSRSLKMAMVGYLLSIVVEIPILIFGLSKAHRLPEKLLAGLWLTACTYPFVAWVFPAIMSERISLTIVRETFAAVAECVLFLIYIKLTEPRQISIKRDLIVVVIANVASFAFGELLKLSDAIWPILSWFELA